MTKQRNEEGFADFRVDVHPDKHLAKIHLGDRHAIVDAEGVTMMVHRLASARMDMLPEMQYRPPEGAATTVQIRHLEIRRFDETAAIDLILGHPGIGWVAYRLQPNDAQTLLATLSTVLAGSPPEKGVQH